MAQTAFKYSLGVNNSVDVASAADVTSLDAGEVARLIVADGAVLSVDDIATLLQGLITHLRDGQAVRSAITAP